MKHHLLLRATLRDALRASGFKACFVVFCIAFAVILAASAVVYGMGAGEKPKGRPTGMPPVPVLADTAVKGDFPVYFQGLGTVTAMNTVTVKSRVDGELIKLHFVEGRDVKAGDLLAEIDPRPYRAELAQAEGQLLRDQALLRNAQQDLKRYKVLLPQDSATPQQVDSQEALVRQYEAAVKVDKGKIDAVKLQLGYCRVTAPIDGRLGLKLVDQGNMVRASDATGLVVITQVRPISVLFTVTENQLPRVLSAMRGGKPLVVEAWDRTRTSLLATGHLLTTDNRIDTATGTVKLKASFDNAEDELFPNQFVNARILVNRLRDVIKVPTAAVQHASRGAFVYVVENGLAKLRDVTVGEGNDTTTVITAGVNEGDVLVIDGLDRLRDGSAVSVTLPGGKGAAAAGSPGGANPQSGRP
ncbi:MdtA/MuxA family multidrug efflux RND transporter periplasmic adaptor subunit [Desulfovibrio sp. OttesenSCG-928-O18]|nr:MdtA/MuxA family multidrug efflux RND transporter periplasmic adaptor subunit [Desulfovibrio sp. OttesenSCG-928-O18]